jgi:hypothetical protein
MQVMATDGLICLVPVLTVGWVIGGLGELVGIAVAASFAADFISAQTRMRRA